MRQLTTELKVVFDKIHHHSYIDSQFVDDIINSTPLASKFIKCLMKKEKGEILSLDQVSKQPAWIITEIGSDDEHDYRSNSLFQQQIGWIR